MAGHLITVAVFLFQAEDGLRAIGVTGVPACALPIRCKLIRVFLVVNIPLPPPPPPSSFFLLSFCAFKPERFRLKTFFT